MTELRLAFFVSKLRFVSLDDELGECWLWTGARQSGGYGHLRVDGRHVLAHRAAYEHWCGDIPSGHEVDHLCRNELCVNPRHLEAVTPQLNVDRSLRHRGCRNSAEHSARIALSMVGREKSAEHRAHLATAWSADRRAKMAAFKRLWWARKREAA
jgi:hypothetical protein